MAQSAAVFLDILDLDSQHLRTHINGCPSTMTRQHVAVEKHAMSSGYYQEMQSTTRTFVNDAAPCLPCLPRSRLPHLRASFDEKVVRPAQLDFLFSEKVIMRSIACVHQQDLGIPRRVSGFLRVFEVFNLETAQASLKFLRFLGGGRLWRF